jgi:Response regulators consisting of a CheY-like receiver domain and a winged-helix DNA-binding domain
MVFHKILIVEDDTSLALPLKDFFEDNDFEVIHTVSGEEAVEVYGTERPSVVLLDIKLPGIDGFEVLEKIQKIDNSIPVIMMTGTEYDEDNQERGYNLRAVSYMQKPVFPKALLSYINNLLDPPETKRCILGRYSIVIQNNELCVNNETYTLKEKDIHVLSILLLKQKEVVSRENLLLSVWKSNDVILNNHLDSSISRIRHILKKYPGIEIKNIYGKGYIISAK